ncbi:MAG: AsmA family protein, partial [Planctomycetota bacterium]
MANGVTRKSDTAVPSAAAATEAAPAATKKPKSRRRKWLFRSGMTLLLLVVVVGAVGVHYTRPNNLKPLLESILSREIGGDVTIGRATLNRGGRLTLDALWLDAPGLPSDRDEFAKLFEAESISVQLNFGRLWRGELRVDDIRIQQPQLHVIEDVDAGELNLEMLAMRPSDADKPFRLKLPPAINLQGARIRFAQIKDGTLENLDAMRLEGELRENPRQKRLYDFELRQYDASANLDSTLTGSVDTERPSLHVNLAGFEVESAHRQFVPPGFRAFWDELRPTGRLPNLSITMGSDDGGRLRFEEAVLELDDVAITPPYTELGRPAPADNLQPVYAPRMTEVNGRFIVDRESVRIENLTGTIEGVRYYAGGRWGLADHDAGTITVSTDPFTLDENPRFLASLPIVGVKLFDRIQPSGRFQASTQFTRAHGGEPVQVSGVVKLLEARATYHKFPFPIQNIRGVVTFDRDRVRLENLTGEGPDGGTVTLRGEIAPPADGAAVRIAVEARGVPFDDHVKNAFTEKRRRGVEQFFDPDPYRALVEEGVIRSSDPALAELSPAVDHAASPDAESLPPVFDLGGNVDVDVLIDRAFGKQAKYKTTVTIDAAGASALFKHWPYPLTGESGQIVVGPTGIELRDVVMVGPTGGRGVIRGVLRQDPSDKTKFRPDLRVEDAELPIDKLLRHSIRVSQRQFVDDLHATGRVVGGATIIQPEGQDKTQWRVDAQVADGVLQPYAGDFRLQAVTGRFVVGNTGLWLDGITGRRGSADLAVDGEFRWGRGGDGFRLEVAGRDLVVEPALLDLLPPDEPARQQLLGLQAAHRPAGVVHGQLVWEKAPSPRPDETSPDGRGGPREAAADPPTGNPDAVVPMPEPRRGTYTLTVEPLNFGLDYRDTRMEFSDMAGRVVVRPGQIDIEQLAAQFSSGRTQADGMIGLDGVTPTALTLTATADAHCPYTRKFLPQNAVDVLDALEVNGDYRLTDARLLVRPAPRGGQADLEFDGRVALVDTQLKIGVPLTQMRGRLEVGVRRFPGERRPRLRFDLDADHLRAADRRIAPLTVQLDNHEDAEFLTFNEILGGVYGGILVGSGRVPLESSRPYRFDITLSDIEVDPFLKPAASTTGVVVWVGSEAAG